MDRFYIITNSDKDKKLEITEKIADYLKTHHKNCEVQQAERKHEGSFHVKQYVNQIYSKLMINGDTRTKRKQLAELISSINKSLT